MTVDEVLSHFGTEAEVGLTSAQVEKHLMHYGINEMPKGSRIHVVGIGNQAI